MGTAWWLALVVGLVVTAATALTRLIDWLAITWGTSLWRTATVHMLSMLTATVFFLLAAVFGHGGYVDGDVTAGSLILYEIREDATPNGIAFSGTPASASRAPSTPG